MSINIDELYRFVQYVAAKDQRGRTTPAEFNLAVQSASRTYFDFLYGRVQDVRKLVSYEKSSDIKDRLLPFVKPINRTPDTKGQFQLPEDYVHYTEFYKKVMISPACGEDEAVFGWESIDVVDDQQISGRLKSKIVGPDKRAFLHMTGDYIQVYPTNIGTIRMIYLRRPVKPVWAFNTTNNRPVYDSTSSVDLEWNEIAFNEIAARVLALVGINLRDRELSQYIQMMKQEGS